MPYGISLILHIDESVFAFIPVSKSGKFLIHRDKQFHSSPALVRRAFCTVSIRVWGIVYCVWVFQNLETDKRIAPHFLIVICRPEPGEKEEPTLKKFDTKQLKKVFTYEYGQAFLREEDSKNLNKEIYRYIDLRTFFEIVGLSKYYVSRKRVFPDHYEKGGYIGTYYLINRFEPVQNLFREQHEKIWREMGKNSDLIQNCPVSCWSLSGGDDYYRWSCYDKPPITICIGTTVRSFIEALDVSSPFFAGKVKNLNKAVGNPDEMALFSKKKAYQCEEEFRFCFPEMAKENDDSDGIVINLKSLDWIKSIHIGTLNNRKLSLSFFRFLQALPSIGDKVYLSVINEEEENKESKEKKMS